MIKAKHYRPTLSATKNKIKEIKTKGTIPKQLLLHVGTNDLEKMTTSAEFVDTYRDIFNLYQVKNLKLLSHDIVHFSENRWISEQSNICKCFITFMPRI